MVLFAVVMLLAAGLMFRKSAPEQSEQEEPSSSRHPIWQISLEGLAVGILTGIVGVGGGFLIVPALVLLGGLSMRIAVGTSLAIIFLKSMVGFWKYLGVLSSLSLSVDWGTISLFIAIGIIGSLVGQQLSGFVNQQRLRQVFAVFLVLMSLLVLGKELPHILKQPTTTASVQDSTIIFHKIGVL